MKIKTVLLLLVLSMLTSCQKGDGDEDYGFAYVYMPQAMIAGGLDNKYNVPSGSGESSYNFKVHDGKLNVILGVLRSGKLSDKAYSVDIKAFETSSEILSAVDGIAMPASIYSLPPTITVPADKSGESFFLSVDEAALKSEAYNGKKLVLTIEISNPSNFELSDTGTSVVVIIDVDSVRAFL